MGKITDTVAEAYDNFYTESDTKWRMLGAKTKAKNLMEVCKNIPVKKVLEVGAGDGSILHYLNEWNFGTSLYALEIASSGVEIIKKRNLKNLIEVQVFDGYELPYGDNTFDLIILSHVLEHVEHERILLRELRRVAKYIAVEVPLDYRFDVDKRMKHFLDYGHINMYTPSLLRFLLQSEGLEIVSEKTTITPPEITEYSEFINKKAPKTLWKSLKISLEYHVKEIAGELMGRHKQEQFANAYTVLVKKSSHELHIF